MRPKKCHRIRLPLFPVTVRLLYHLQWSNAAATHPQMRMCTYCGEARAAGADMARHVGLKHEPRTRCFQCGQSMAKSLYGDHLIAAHGWSEGNPEGSDRRCR